MGLEQTYHAHQLISLSFLSCYIDIAILSACPSVRDVPVSDENSLT